MSHGIVEAEEQLKRSKKSIAGSQARRILAVLDAHADAYFADNKKAESITLSVEEDATSIAFAYGRNYGRLGVVTSDLIGHSEDGPDEGGHLERLASRADQLLSQLREAWGKPIWCVRFYPDRGPAVTNENP